MEKWELLHKRNSLIDSISTLRGLLSSCESDADIQLVFGTLFLEQHSQLRTSVPRAGNNHQVASPSNLARAVLLRVLIFKHLATACPMLADDTRELGSFTYDAHTMAYLSPAAISLIGKPHTILQSRGGIWC